MQINDTPENFQSTVLSELRKINQRLDHLETDVSDLKVNSVKVETRLIKVEQLVEKADFKFDTYQKASDSMVRLATTIIVAAATVAILPSALSAIAPLINAVVERIKLA